MERMINYESVNESSVLKAFKTQELRRINTNAKLFFDEKTWLSKKIRQKQLSPDEIDSFHSQFLEFSISFWRKQYEIEEAAYGSKYLAVVLAQDYFTDLTASRELNESTPKNLEVSRYLAYQAYLDTIQEDSSLNRVFATMLMLRVREEKLRKKLADPKISREEYLKTNEELAETCHRQSAYMEKLKEEFKIPPCPGAQKYKRAGQSVPEEHVEQCSICKKYERKLQITGKKVSGKNFWIAE